jgi:two-component system sensor histidine kinase BaeS
MRSLRGQLILSHILPLLVILPVAGFALSYLLETQVLLSSQSKQLTNQAILVAQIAEDYGEIWGSPSRAQQFVNGIAPLLTANVRLLNAKGQLLVSSDTADQKLIGQVFQTPSYPSGFASPDNVKITYRNVGGTELAEVIVPVILPNQFVIGYVWLTNPLASVYERTNQLRQLIILVFGIALALGIGAALLIAFRLERPLKRTTQAVYQLANGTRTTPLEESGPEEVKLLARAYNTLLERLQTLETSRRQLLANLVHELGRPLGALRSAAQAMLGGADEDPALRRDLLQGMDDELNRLQSLLEELADLHDQVLGTLEMNYQPVQLESWLTRVVAPWREAVQEKHLHWELNYPQQLPTVEMDPDRIAQVVGNLLSNAIRYTPAGGKVAVVVSTQDDTLSIQVSDTGPGIPREEQGRIFTPFFRGVSTGRFPQGMGLGLTIARDLVQAHHGQITVDSVPGQGSRFTVELPLVQEHQPEEKPETLPQPT